MKSQGLHKLVMAVNRAYLMSESMADSKCSNNSPEIPLRLKRSRSNDKETSIKVLPSVLGPSFPSDFLTVSTLQYKSPRVDTSNRHYRTFFHFSRNHAGFQEETSQAMRICLGKYVRKDWLGKNSRGWRNYTF